MADSNPERTLWVNSADAIIIYDHNSSRKVDKDSELVMVIDDVMALTGICSLDAQQGYFVYG